MIPILLSKSTPCARPPPPIPALPQKQSLLPMSMTPPPSSNRPPVPPARNIPLSNKLTHNQQATMNSSSGNEMQKNLSSCSSLRPKMENYYITSSLISRVSSKDQLNSKDQLTPSDSVNNLTRLGQAARMRRCLSSTSPLSSASTCSSTGSSSNDHHVQAVVHPVPDDMSNYTEVDHDKEDKANIKKQMQSYLSQSQTSLSGSSSFFMDDDNWYSELIMSKPAITSSVIKSSDYDKFIEHQHKYKNNSNIDCNNYQMGSGTNKCTNNHKVKRSSTFNSDDDSVHGLIGVPSTTPSPSDSGITDQLEGMLREKDSEIALLRETLEQNEQVIFKVYQEKEESWKKMYETLRTQYESSLTMYQQEVVKCNHQLNSTIQQASDDRKQLEIELGEFKSMNEFLQDRIGSMSKEITLLKTQLNSSEWTLRQKIQELSLIQSESNYENVSKQTNVDPNEHTHEIVDKNQDKVLIAPKDSQLKMLIGQLNETKSIAESKSRSAIEMEEELKSSRIELSDFKETFSKSIKLLQEQTQELIEERRKKDSLIASLNEETIELRYQLGNLKEELATNKEGFEEERANWKDEKDRVIKYQKKLNSDYVKLLKKNKELENELKSAKNQYQIIQTDAVQC